MTNDLKTAITEYAERVNVEFDDIIEIIYTLCANCPISVANMDKLSLHLELPDGSTCALFEFESVPASLMVDIAYISNVLPEHGISPFEADELFGACAYYSVAPSDHDRMYLDLHQTLLHLDDICRSVQGFANGIYAKHAKSS